MINTFEIRLCENKSCGLRYPLMKGHPFGERCPRCLGDTVAVNSREIDSESRTPASHPTTKLEVLLDNVRSAWNVGSIFRTADGFGVNKIYLAGITPTPENPAVKKTALGAGFTIPWEAFPNAVDAVNSSKNEGKQIWALEQDYRSVSIHSKIPVDTTPILLIVGNEVSGVDPDLLDLCDRILEIPMLGKKRSLNVEVAFGITISTLRELLG